mgnify:CR=1 FL=1
MRVVSIFLQINNSFRNEKDLDVGLCFPLIFCILPSNFTNFFLNFRESE